MIPVSEAHTNKFNIFWQCMCILYVFIQLKDNKLCPNEPDISTQVFFAHDQVMVPEIF